MAVFTAATALSCYSWQFCPPPSCEESILPLQRQIARALQLPVELSVWMLFNPAKRFCWTS